MTTKKIMMGDRELQPWQAQAPICGEPMALEFYPAPVDVTVREGDPDGVTFGNDGSLTFSKPGARLLRFTYADGTTRDMTCLAFEPACLELVPSTAESNRSPRESEHDHKRRVLQAFASNPMRRFPRTGRAADMRGAGIAWSMFGA